MIKPGTFGKNVPADVRRQWYDFQNEQLLFLKQRPDYLFIGDSITELWDIHLYLETDKFIVNRAIGGDCSIYLRKRFDADCIQLQPKTVIMMIGTNDIARSEDDLWWHIKGEPEDAVLAQYRENVTDIVQKCDNAGIELILCSVPPSEIAPPNNRMRRWRMADEMNRFLQTLGKPFVDYRTVLSADGKRYLPGLSPDGIHPNGKAYIRMAELLSQFIEL